MRDEKEGRSKQGQTNTQGKSNTAHPRQSLFLRKMSCLGWDSNPHVHVHVHTCILVIKVLWFPCVDSQQSELPTSDPVTSDPVTSDPATSTTTAPTTVSVYIAKYSYVPADMSPNPNHDQVHTVV